MREGSSSLVTGLPEAAEVSGLSSGVMDRVVPAGFPQGSRFSNGLIFILCRTLSNSSAFLDYKAPVLPLGAGG